MLLGIVGSRKISFSEAEPFIVSAIKKYKPHCLVSGGAIGVDRHAKTIANRFNIPIIEYLPDWSLGLHAGFLRNTEIALKSDVLICIFSGAVKKGGTLDTYKKAKKLGKPCECVLLSENQLYLF